MNNNIAPNNPQNRQNIQNLPVQEDNRLSTINSDASLNEMVRELHRLDAVLVSEKAKNLLLAIDMKQAKWELSEMITNAQLHQMMIEKMEYERSCNIYFDSIFIL